MIIVKTFKKLYVIMFLFIFQKLENAFPVSIG